MRSAVQICRELDAFLRIDEFKDASLNGLQLDAANPVRRIVCGVSANAALIDKAIAADAQLLIVHHGWLWGRCERFTGMLGARLRRCIEGGLSVAGYHLPLDAHPQVGNNAGLCELLNLQNLEPFAQYAGSAIGFKGDLAEPVEFATLVEQLGEGLGGINTHFGDAKRLIRSVGLCSGGAANNLQEASDEGLDLYLTGEAEEWTQAQADELDICFVAGGHHRTERFGPRRLADHINQSMGIDARFIDVPNPV
ncbi:MAG: Nif3-like dinuclear metal center hexameric protein [Myxococcota bacterium]|nr:Nif3-like dinuclear metal center hexameric protein [Myxococcota bacterium]